jgi:hypothetical protein
MTKKHDLGENKFRLSRAIAVECKICVTPTASPLKARKLKFRLPEFLGQLDVLHTQNSEIWNP